MKKFRRGFTLAELLIVIAIIGVLSSMMMVASSSVADTARALKIIEGFKSVSAAMITYYNNNAETCDAGVEASAIKTGAARFLRDGGKSVVDTATPGKYAISVFADDGSWWLTYQLAGDETKVGEILKDQAESQGFKAEVGELIY